MSRKFLTPNMKIQARKDLEGFVSDVLHPKHSASDSSIIFQRFYQFRGNPTLESYIVFLAAFFQRPESKILKLWKEDDELNLVLGRSGHQDLLFDASVVMLATYPLKSVPNFLDVTLDAVLPLDNGTQLADFLVSRFPFGFSLDQKFSVLQWIRKYFLINGVPLKFPRLDQSASLQKKAEEIEAFIKYLHKSNINLSSPFKKVFLTVQEKPNTGGELIGKLELVIELEPGKMEFAHINLAPQPTHFLGFLIEADHLVTARLELNSVTKVHCNEIETWNQKADVLPINVKNFWNSVVKVANRLNKDVSTKVMSQLGGRAFKHKDRLMQFVLFDKRRAWVNSASRPIGKGLSVSHRKKVLTCFKKPRTRRS